MRLRMSAILGIAVFFIFIDRGLVFSQTLGEEVMAPAAESETEPDIEWVWAEALSVDVPNNSITVKHYNYEVDKEEELTLTVDAETAYENINSLSEIKAGDTLGIDYIIDKDAKKTAKRISIEKPESEMQAPEAQVAPGAQEAPEAQGEGVPASQ